MTQSNVAQLTVKAILIKSLDLHFEQPLGTTVTSVYVQTQFFFVGYYKENGNPIPYQRIYIYQVDSVGANPIYVGVDYTDTNGRYALAEVLQTEAPNEMLYFRAYDDEDKPT